jgi:hypothetical protein
MSSDVYSPLIEAPRDGTSMPRTVDRPMSGVDWTGPCARQSLSAGRTSRH